VTSGPSATAVLAQPAPDRRVPFFDLRPVLSRAAAAIEENLAAMHASGRYILSEQVRSFEAELAQAFGAGHAVGTGSGTTAIELCLRQAGVVRRGQEVIVPANTSPFTAQAVLSAGASLRFADVDPDTLLLTAESAERAWTPRTAAVIAVHLYGRACDLAGLKRLCEERGAVLVQDACQAHGLRIGGRPLTDFSPYTAYSFYPTKNLGCLGDGGAVLTTSVDIAAELKRLRDGGREDDQLARVAAINSRLDELHACYLRALLPHLEHWNQHRSRIAAVYDGMLQSPTRGLDNVHHLYIIRARNRDQLRAELLAEGIQTGVHYPAPLHLHPAFASPEHPPGSLPHAEAACGQVLSLPIGPHIDESLAERIAESVRRRL
jgi:dTDP-4-amino-4,6-dideoxygalactose transaminase